MRSMMTSLIARLHSPPTAARCRTGGNGGGGGGVRTRGRGVSASCSGFRAAVHAHMAFHLHHGVVAGTEILQLPPGTSRHCHRAQLADAHHIRQCQSGLELRQLVGGRHEQRQVPREADRVLVRQEGGVGRDHYLRECVRCDVGDVRRLHVCSAVALHIRPDNVGQCRRRRGRLVAFGGG
jgi:hypothetical protein